MLPELLVVQIGEHCKTITSFQPLTGYMVLYRNKPVNIPYDNNKKK